MADKFGKVFLKKSVKNFPNLWVSKMNWYKVVILKVRTVMGTETKVEKSPSLKKRLGKHPVLIITSICSICFAVVAGLLHTCR